MASYSKWRYGESLVLGPLPLPFNHILKFAGTRTADAFHNGHSVRSRWDNTQPIFDVIPTYR